MVLDLVGLTKGQVREILYYRKIGVIKEMWTDSHYWSREAQAYVTRRGRYLLLFLLFGILVWVPLEADFEEKIQVHGDYMGSKGNMTRGGELDQTKEGSQ